MINLPNLFESVKVLASPENTKTVTSTISNVVNGSGKVSEQAMVKATEASSKGLGIDPFQIGFYIICFLIAMVVLNKFLFSAIIKILDERKARVDKALDETDELESKMQDINNQAQQITDNAKAEARSIIENAKKDAEPAKAQVLAEADQARTDILATASNDAKKILDNARATAESEGVAVVQKILTKSVSNMKLSDASSQSILSEIINKVS